MGVGDQPIKFLYCFIIPPHLVTRGALSPNIALFVPPPYSLSSITAPSRAAHFTFLAENGKWRYYALSVNDIMEVEDVSLDFRAGRSAL